jgi:hypothetical protein
MAFIFKKLKGVLIHLFEQPALQALFDKLGSKKYHK